MDHTTVWCAQSFADLCVSDWNDEISGVARREIEPMKFNNPTLLPLTSDVPVTKLRIAKGLLYILFTCICYHVTEQMALCFLQSEHMFAAFGIPSRHVAEVPE